MADEEDGRTWERRDPEAVLDAMKPGEPYTTGELADALNWPRRSTLNVLDELADEGRVVKKKPEPRRAIWMVSDE